MAAAVDNGVICGNKKTQSFLSTSFEAKGHTQDGCNSSRVGSDNQNESINNKLPIDNTYSDRSHDVGAGSARPLSRQA